MIVRHSKLLLGLALLTAAGCATVPEHDVALDDARLAVNAARSNPQVVTYAPVELDQAVSTLRDADSITARNGPTDEAHRLALLAGQRAALAQDAARSRSAEAALILQQNAQVAQVQADLGRRQAEAAQLQVAAAQRQAEEAQRQVAVSQLQAQAMQLNAAPPAELVGIPALPTARGIVVTLEDTTFDPGSSQLRPSGMDTVRRIAGYLAAHPERVVAIEGFADTSSNGDFDRNLSQQRALVVQSALVTLGVDPRRTIVRTYDPDYPVASNATAAGCQMNRRVEIVVSDRDGFIAPRGALAAPAILAADAGPTAPLPEIRSQGTVTYVNGGIGQEEAAALRREASLFPLSLEFVRNNGTPNAEFLTDVDVTIRDQQRSTVLATLAGPMLLARIPAGRYTVTADEHGQIKQRSVVVTDRKPEHLVFAW